MKFHADQIVQMTAARIAGVMYLITMAMAVFSHVFDRGSLVEPGNAARTAANIQASELYFRIGIAADLVTFIGVVVLTWALYLLRRPGFSSHWALSDRGKNHAQSGIPATL